MIIATPKSGTIARSSNVCLPTAKHSGEALIDLAKGGCGARLGYTKASWPRSLKVSSPFTTYRTTKRNVTGFPFHIIENDFGRGGSFIY